MIAFILFFISLTTFVNSANNYGTCRESNRGWACRDGYSELCECQKRYSTFGGSRIECTTSVRTKCDLGCKSGKCLSASQVCGTSNRWAGNKLTYSSEVCPLNGVVLPAAWVTWANIQDDSVTLENYLLGVDSDATWFDRQMEEKLFIPSGPNSSVTYVNGSKPASLQSIHDSCRPTYEQFTCERNLPECSNGNPKYDNCQKACEDVSVCFGQYYTACQAAKADNATAANDFTCISVRDVAQGSECWEPFCFVLEDATGGTANQGWRRDCEYMCREYQQNTGDATPGMNMFFASVAFLVTLLAKV